MFHKLLGSSFFAQSQTKAFTVHAIQPADDGKMTHQIL